MAYDSRNYTFTWKIENFSLSATENGTPLVSPTFKALSIGGSEWYLKLYPRGNTDDKFVSCYLHRIKNDAKEKTDFEIKIIGEDKEILKTLNSKNNIVTENGLGWNSFLAIDKLNEKMVNSKNDILTIDCFIESYSTAIRDHVGRSEARTKIVVERCHFQWKVKYFDSSDFENKRGIFVEKNFRFEFTLAVLNDEIEINIRSLGKITSETKLASCKISLMNLKGDELASERSKYLFKRSNTDAQNNWKFPSFFSKKMIVDKADELLQDNSFTLMCELSVSNGNLQPECKLKKLGGQTSSNDASLDTSVKTLNNDLVSMFQTKKCSDIKLCVENLTVPAHKCILVARSPVFSAMFDQDMSENQTGTVNIEDMDAKTLNSFLEYIYTGDVKGMEVETAMPLMLAADKYQVSSLTAKCFVLLKSKLSVEIVCEIYTLANTINHELLKSSALEFVESNSAEVLSSKVWCDWMKGNVELANEILYKMALNDS